jgi:hypothetical protein
VLQPVHVGHKSLADYGTLVSRSLMQELRRLAEPTAGRSSTLTAIRTCTSSAT